MTEEGIPVDRSIQDGWISKGIDILPPELVIQVLRTCLPLPLDRPGRKQFQLLRCICSLWRNLAFSTPDLWSSLFVDLSNRTLHPKVDNSQRGDYSARMQGWFSRAGDGIPLELTLRLASRSIRPLELKSLSEWIGNYRSRWKTLNLLLYDEAYTAILRNPCQTGDWSRLDSLSFNVPSQRSIHFDLPLLDRMPSLRTLNIQKGLNGMIQAPSACPNVERLALTMTCSDAMTVATSFPNLTRLRIWCPTSDNGGVASNQTMGPLHLLSLQILELAGSSIVIDFLNRVHCPDLRAFTLMISSNHRSFTGEDSWHMGIVRFINGSSKLERMSLVGLVPPAMAAVLEASTETKASALELDIWPYIDLDNPPQTLLPSICKLTIWGVGRFASNDLKQRRMESFLKFLGRRCKDTGFDGVQHGAGGSASLPLEEVVVGKDMLVGELPEAEIDTLRARGMTIEVRNNWAMRV
ncbi:hypothetical protein CC2G_006798 [Coprinopsis cinerea AmutBmut pab1-1]|nr:hypothetical protein CC2G_006798 [Coprinopsis cinerea AmutBmut pab1-1]